MPRRAGAWTHIAWAALGILIAAGAAPRAALASPTYYVDGASGDDTRTATQAQDPATPWKTIKKAVSSGGLIGMTNQGVVLDGYTVVVAPGLYVESVESKRDLPLWIAGFQPQGPQWVFSGDGGAVNAVLVKQADGSVTFTVNATGLSPTAVKFPTSASLRVGDDFASATLLLEGTLRLSY